MLHLHGFAPMNVKRAVPISPENGTVAKINEQERILVLANGNKIHFENIMKLTIET